MKNICYIFAAGDFSGDFTKADGDFIIAADAGFHHLKKIGIAPDLLVGDFDTIGEIPNLENKIQYPTEKNYTDTELAIIQGINKGFKKFIICGALGGKRLEHTIANIALASSYVQKGYEIMLTDGDYSVQALHNSHIEFTEKHSGFISVFPFGSPAKGVCETGLKYSLDNATLDSSNPTLCVSNEFTGQKSRVSVTDGTIIIIWQNKQK